MSGQTFNDSGIDRSMGLLVMGMIVVGFLLLLIVGMDGVQKQARNISAESLESPAHSNSEKAPVYDFVE